MHGRAVDPLALDREEMRRVASTVVADGDVELVVLPDRTLELAMHLVPRLDRARLNELLARR